MDAGAVGHQGQIAGAAALPLGNLERLGALMGQQSQGDGLFMQQAFRLAITGSSGGVRGGHVRSVLSGYNVERIVVLNCAPVNALCVFMSIFLRLREERERLGLTQEAFGAAGGVLKRAVINYEKGERFPDAAFMAGVAAAGADVQYIVTGKRAPADAGALSYEETELLNLYKKADVPGRDAVQAVAALAARNAGAPHGRGRATHAVTIGGDVGQQVHGDQTVTAPMTFNVGGKRK